MTMSKIEFLKKYCKPSRKLQNEKHFYTQTIEFTPEHNWLELKIRNVMIATYIYSAKYDSTLMWITNRGYINLCCYNHEYEEEGMLIKIPGKLEKDNWYKETRFEKLFTYLYNKHEKEMEEELEKDKKETA